MALKRARPVEGATQAESTKSSGVITVNLPTRLVRRLTLADAAVKRGVEAVKSLKELIFPTAAEAAYKANIAAKSATAKSIKIVDASKAAVRVTFQDKYPAISKEALPKVEAVFDEAGLDINKFIHEVPVPTFDTDVLMKADGTLNRPLYDTLREVIRVALEEAVQDRIIETMPENPLAAENKVIVKPEFNKARFEHMTAEQNKTLHKALPCTVTFTALADEG